jgi:hypothetical protein
MLCIIRPDYVSIVLYPNLDIDYCPFDAGGRINFFGRRNGDDHVNINRVEPFSACSLSFEIFSLKRPSVKVEIYFLIDG